MKKIVVHDFAGHPFQLDLSKEFSLNDEYKLFHIYFDSGLGPKGDFANNKSDVEIIGIKLAIKYSKNNIFKRAICEFIYGLYLLFWLHKIKPDVVLSGNCPIDSYWGIFLSKRIFKFKLIYWVQDIYGTAIKSILSNKLGIIGLYVGKIYEYREKQQFRSSDALVTISDIMHEYISSVVEDKNIDVRLIPNWGNLSEIHYTAPIKSKELPTLIYTGTLGFKHDPDVLIRLSNHLKGFANIEVYTQGSAVDCLKNKNNSSNLKIYDLLPFDEFTKKLQSSSGFLCIVEEEASKYCVPSKVQNYLCAGRPIFIIGDIRNAASQIIKEHNCGIIGSKVLIEDLSSKIVNYFENEKGYLDACYNARKYAEENFKISKICFSFMELT